VLATTCIAGHSVPDPEKSDYRRPPPGEIPPAIAFFKALLTQEAHAESEKYEAAHLLLIKAVSHFDYYDDKTKRLIQRSANELIELLKSECFVEKLPENTSLHQVNRDVMKLIKEHVLAYNDPEGWCVVGEEPPKEVLETAKDALVLKEQLSYFSRRRGQEQSERMEPPDKVKQLLREFLILTEECAPDPFTKQAEEVRGRQIELIADFGIRFMEDYWPVLDTGGTALQKDWVQEQFKELFPPAIPSLFFSMPANIGRPEKNMVTALIASLDSFFGIYLEAFKKKKKRKDEDLFTLMIDADHLLIPKDCSPPALSKKLCETTQQLLTSLLLIGTQDARQRQLQRFNAFMITAAFARPVYNSLSPYLFNLILDRLFLDDIDLSFENPAAPSLDLYNADDLQFSRDLAVGIEGLVKKILTLGEAGRPLKMAAEGAVKRLKKPIGTKFHKALNMLFNNECALQPVLILRELFYKGGKPALLDAFKTKSEEERRAFRADVEKRIKGRLTALIKKHSKVLSSLSDRFCTLLSDRLYMITQDERIYRLLLIFILDALNKAVKDEQAL